jgi:hypothetical protein
MIPFVFSAQACTTAGACVATAISAPAWVGVVVVGGATLVGSKLISATLSKQKKEKLEKLDRLKSTEI